ncbi:UDP-4-amino-4,6-dideoxy-N-acetyl-beta-L-altrosamine transaminase [Pseudomonas sp. TE3786]
MIPYGRQSISAQDIDAVVEVLRSDWLTQGPTIERFEQAMATTCEARHAVAVSNATAALHIACLALDLGPGDWLWTSPNTFVASANCGLYCGAQVDFVDIDPLTLNLSVPALAAKLAQAQGQGRLPKIVVPVAFAGQSCDMAGIRALAEQYGFKIIEDASHAVGASYRGRPVGCGDYADITVFSFHPVKIITTGEGGLLTTQDDHLAERLRRLRSHGITRDPALMTQPSDGPWYYQQLELGYNYRITDIQAALGLSQLTRLHAFVTRRRALAARYAELLADLPLTLPSAQQGAESAWHLYPVRLQLDGLHSDQGQIFTALRAAGIGVNLHYIPVHLQPFYRQLGFATGDFPEAERYYRQAISLPLFPDMTDEQQEQVVQALISVLH